ncbi:MAG: hypothetical protein NTY81_03980 [Candidatus Staskawiczbacteria bacterium]|nr:hypothetical protein [Candidatus Staskawiczbacteria bacterium]
MNKKTLFLVLLGILVLPGFAYAADVGSIAGSVQTAVVNVGVPLIVVGWVIAGILYLTSAGSPEKTGTAKKALIAAVIGTLLIVLSGVAISLVRTTFGIPASL